MVDPKQAIDVLNSVYGRHEGFRAIHSKGRFYTGTFTPTEGAALECRALHFQQEVPVLVRFSNASGNPHHSDNAQDVRGMAVSFKLPDGTATDLLGQTSPRFPVRTVEKFLELTKAGQKKHLLPVFAAQNLHAVPSLFASLRAKSTIPPFSYAEVPYYPIHAYQWIAPSGTKRWVRYNLNPISSEKDRPAGTFSGKNRLQDELLARLEKRPVRYTLEVHIAHADDDPHDPTSVWDKDSRHLDAGTITVTGPAEDPEKDGGLVVFDPTRIVDGIELSNDPILRYRAGAYSESVNRRV